MRRWFRRKGKDTDQDEENGTAPLVEETEPSPEAVAGPAAAGEEAVAEPGPAIPAAPELGGRSPTSSPGAGGDSFGNPGG